ncbi:MAG: HEAT repeat domain-containing protein [Vicinamibacterales bacterium]
MMRLILIGTCSLSAVLPLQQARFDDVVRNLRNPDPEVRLDALRMLRESQHVEAITPIAPLVNDPLDGVQLEAIAAELSFYLVENVAPRKKVAFIIETRSGAGRAQTAFEAGPLAVWPRPVPEALVANLLKAVEDDNAKVRIEAIYALGTIARGPLPSDADQQLIKALDHYDPAIRAGSARVLGRLQVKSAGQALIKAVNDSQEPVRFAAMRALGAIREESAITALTQQVDYYKKSEGAWSALDALAHIGHPSSVPLFKARLVDKDAYMRRAAAEGLARAGDSSELAALETGASTDPADTVRAAMAFALQKLGRNYVPRLAESLKSDKLARQVAEYFIELGPSLAASLAPHLKDPDEAIRANAALILGAIGSQAEVVALEPVTKDRDREVARAATRAIERIKMRATQGP